MITDYIYYESERAYTKYRTRDPYELLDSIGAVTQCTYEYGRNGLKGYSTVLNRTKYAVINARLHEAEQRVVAGHEAAHLILHMDEIMCSPVRALHDFHMWDNSGRIEHQANLFLADFLLADDDVLDAIQAEDEDRDFFTCAHELCIPPPLLAFKLYSMARRGYDMRSPVGLDSKFLRK